MTGYFKLTEKKLKGHGFEHKGFWTIIRVSHSLKIQKKGTCSVHGESFEKGTYCVHAPSRKDQRGISDIMWKSTSIFTGTGRLTVEH